jgi:hypothetical protein
MVSVGPTLAPPIEIAAPSSRWVPFPFAASGVSAVGDLSDVHPDCARADDSACGGHACGLRENLGMAEKARCARGAGTMRSKRRRKPGLQAGHAPFCLSWSKAVGSARIAPPAMIFFAPPFTQRTLTKEQGETVTKTLERDSSLRSVRCLRCNRLLTDAESIDRGMGPVCAKQEACESASDGW